MRALAYPTLFGLTREPESYRISIPIGHEKGLIPYLTAIDKKCKPNHAQDALGFE
jgi:hypothetical protein